MNLPLTLARTPKRAGLCWSEASSVAVVAMGGYTIDTGALPECQDLGGYLASLAYMSLEHNQPCTSGGGMTLKDIRKDASSRRLRRPIASRCGGWSSGRLQA